MRSPRKGARRLRWQFSLGSRAVPGNEKDALTVNVGVDEAREDRQVPKIDYFTIKGGQVDGIGEGGDLEYDRVCGYGDDLVIENIQGIRVKQFPSQDNHGRHCRFALSLWNGTGGRQELHLVGIAVTVVVSGGWW